jgi:hypothetical protein
MCNLGLILKHQSNQRTQLYIARVGETRRQIHAANAERVPSKAIKIVLFWSNWLLVLFLGKRFIGPPADNVDFLLKNFATFVIAIIGTTVMPRYLHGVILKVTIAAVCIVTILIAVVL